ncbi:hypothetical protein [Pyxidicoccus sp. MSG2]|uniref:hypothetical protein n=1 Tax=Pyxidicoccus sp. MSG2 TaxID=2996790 RepID=UPI00226DDBD5|nr:hypothetical protein [Pyxidicoccus sp. MSG2]MCY1023978.1 hypothetical protein [Pyxidicoccus sp. MSG2]
MSWQDGYATMLELVMEALPYAREVPDALLLREAAPTVAAACWGPTALTSGPELVNMAALAILGRTRLVAHQVRPAAARQVGETDLHSLPDSPSRLLRGPWMLEVRRPEAGERLWGDTVALAGYEVEPNTTFLLGLGASGWCRVVHWRPRWTGEELEEGTRQMGSPLVDDMSTHEAWAREAARFAVVLGLLLDAEGAPLRVEEERQRDTARRVKKGGGAAEGLHVRHVYLDEERVARAPSPAGPGSDVDGTAGRLADQVLVRGHLKRQRHGPGNRAVKWLYIAGYSARRWVAPGVTQVVVSS